MTHAEVVEIQKGDRVVMTALGYERLVKNSYIPKARVTSGICRGRSGLGISVRRDEHKCTEHYHIDFWEKRR